ncbi:MAG: hypothetical protein AAGN66_11400 [Acidobacteriota bacterium]
MTTIYGSITSGGGVSINSGQIKSVSKLGTGKFQIDLAPGTFNSTPVVVATVMVNDGDCNSDGSNRTISLNHVSATQICVAIRVSSEGNEMSDRPFNFIAML